MMWYQADLEVEDGIFLVSIPNFPEVATFGEDLQAALLNARNAIEEAIAARVHFDEDIPTPQRTSSSQGYWVQIPALTYLKSALYMHCRSQKITRADLVRRLGVHREQVDRLFRLDHNSQLSQLEAAFDAIGIPLAFDIPMPAAA